MRRVAPHAGVLLAVVAWWAFTSENALRVPLGWLARLLLLRLALQLLRVPARWRARPAAWRRDLPRWWVAVVVTLACCALMPGVMLRFETLAGWDFPLHAWHTHVLVEELFPSLRGWTWSQNFGWAEGDDYSLVAYLPAALLHLLSFKVVGVEAAVALEVAVVTAGMPIMLALYLGRGLSTPVVLTGALVVLLDPGLFHQGGLTPLMVAGMWPVRLSMTLCVAAMWAADAYVQSPSRKTLWWAIWATFAAAQTHTVGVTYVGAALLVWLVLSAGTRVSGAYQATLWLGLGAAMLTTGWMLMPFYALKDNLVRLGEGHHLLHVFGEHLQSLTFFDRATPLEMALALVGTVLLLQRRHLAGRMALVGFLLASLWLSLELIAALLPAEHRELADRFQWSRYFFFGRTGLMFAAGCALAWGTAYGVRWWLHPRRGNVALYCVTCSLALACTGAAEGYAQLWPKTYLKRSMETPPALDLPYGPSLDAAGKWLAQQKTADTLLVVDLPLKNEPSGHLAGWVNMRSGVPVMAVHRQGTFHFKDFGPRDGQNTYEELSGAGATHWLSVGRPTGGAPPLTELQTFPGDVHLYELPRVLADQRVNAPVPITVDAWDAQHLTFTGPDTGYELSLRARWHPRWSVTQGVGVVISRGVFMPGSRPVFMRLKVPPGVTQVTLSCGPPGGWEKGYVVTALGAALLGLVWVWSRRLFPRGV